MTTRAITRKVPQTIAQCALTFLSRDSIDMDLACREHEGYERQLRGLGLEVVSLDPVEDMPDSAFVEDTAVVVDEVAVMTRPSLLARRREVESVAAVLERYRPVRWLSEPGTLEGGDVLVIGKNVFAGRSGRTTEEGIRRLREELDPYGYGVISVDVPSCLHLKTGCSHIGGSTILLNPSWIDPGHFTAFRVIEVPPTEPFAANALRIAGKVILPDSFPRTREVLERSGFEVVPIAFSELQKAEAGLTCCSIMLSAAA